MKTNYTSKISLAINTSSRNRNMTTAAEAIKRFAFTGEMLEMLQDIAKRGFTIRDGQIFGVQFTTSKRRKKDLAIYQF